MQFPPEIAFRGFEPDEWLKDTVRREIDRLDGYFDRIVGCRVMVELPHQRREEGNPYHVRIELSVPGRNLVVSRSPKARDRERETQMTALDEAFAAIRRRLEDYTRELRGDVKRKLEPAHGRVWQLYPGGVPGERYGFIRTPDGSDVYFHENSLLGTDYDQVEVGAEVRFHEEQGDEGPQASTVRVLERVPADANDPGASGGAAGGASNGGGPAGDAGRGEPLSVENADLLLNELEESLAGLSDGDRESHLIERTEKLLASLDDLPGPPALLRDPVADLRAWTRILLDDDGNGRHPGPGGPADVVEHQVSRVREVLERERTLSA
ncbi:MAG: HPF/RaiA family ribosome-associated protein [Gemmatimonadota bacterium]